MKVIKPVRGDLYNSWMKETLSRKMLKVFVAKQIRTLNTDQIPEFGFGYIDSDVSLRNTNEDNQVSCIYEFG